MASGARAAAGLSTVLERPRLVDLVEGRRVVLVEAPGGYGKTTLAEQIVAAWGHAAVRVRFTQPVDLDAAVRELLRGARRAGLVDVVEAAAPGDRQATDPHETLDSFVGALTARADVTIFLDDVHHLGSEVAIELATALGNLASRTIVAGRALDEFSLLSRVAGAGWIAADELRMRDGEIAELLDPDTPAAVVDEIAMATGGWSAAVVLAVARVQQDPGWSPARGSGSRAVLAELLDEIAGAHPAWPALANVHLLDAEVVTAIAGDGSWEPARRSGLLQAAGGRWFTIPDPFGEALQARAPETSLSDEQRRTIAGHYHRQGETLAAVELLTGGHTTVELARFLAACSWTDAEAVGADLLGRACARLDDLAVSHAPEALLVVARAVELIDPPLRRSCLARLRRSSIDPVTARSTDAEVARDLVADADLDRARELAQRVLDDSGDGELVSRARALATIARAEVFACTSESLAAGGRSYGEAAALLREAGEPRWLAETLARRGYTALYMGGFPAEGAAEMHHALALLPIGDFTRGFWLTNYADVLLYLGRGPEAEAAIDEALEIGARRRDEIVIMMGWWSRSWIAARSGRRAEFAAAISHAERHIGPWVREGQLVEYYGSSAEMAVLVDDHDVYERYSARARELGAAISYEFPARLAEARHAAMVGDPDLAVSLLSGLDHGQAVVPSSLPTRNALRALALARGGDAAGARAALEEAEAAAQRMSVPDLLPRMESRVVELLADALDPGDRPHQAEHTIVAPPVVVRLLGGFSVTVRGTSQTPPSGHPSALVKLLALRGELTTEAVIDAFWPEADLATGRSRVRNLLNRLRDRSGDLVVRTGDSLRIADQATTDVTVFDAAAAAALAAPADQRVGLARHAIALFGGELLPGDVYDDWTAGPRERLRRRYLALVDLVADDALERQDTDEAVRLLDLAIDAEPLDVRRYSHLCAALLSQGRRTAAREVAARAAKTFGELDEPLPADLHALLA